MSSGGSSSNSVPGTGAFWNNALQKSGTAQYKIRKSDVIHFQEFHTSIAYTDDVYWKKVLYDASRKKLPRNFMYADFVLRYRPKETYITLSNTNPGEFCAAAIFFLREQGRIYSPRDVIEIQKRTEERIFETLAKRTESWASVASSKPRRTMYVRDYIEKYYKSYPKDLREQLFTQINIAFGTKYITKDHISFENGEITKIDGFTITSLGKIEMTRAFRPPKEKIRRQGPSAGGGTVVKSKLYQHQNRWFKWVTNFEKKIGINAKSSYTKTVYSSSSGTASSLLQDDSDMRSDAEADADTETENRTDAGTTSFSEPVHTESASEAETGVSDDSVSDSDSDS